MKGRYLLKDVLSSVGHGARDGPCMSTLYILRMFDHRRGTSSDIT